MTNDLRLTQSASGRAALAPEDDDFKAKALIFRAKRQELLASNIANADTPNYKARDISFSDSLREARLGLTSSGSAVQQTAPGHIALSGIAEQSTLSFARYVHPNQSNLDGNTVDMDRERGEFAQNAILYQAAVSFLDDEFKEFKMASSDPRR